MAIKRKLPKFDFNVFEKITPVLLVATIALSFVVGILWEKVTFLEKGGGTTTLGTQTVATASTAPAAPAAASVTQDQIKGLFDKDLVKFGDGNRKVLFVEVADPSCPYCHAAGGHDSEVNNNLGATFKLTTDGGNYLAPVPEMKKLVDDGKASFVYIYYPGHGNGEMGMKALYCANEKGKFWEVHDLLMSNAGYNLMNNDVKNDKAQSGKVANFLKSVFNAADMKNCIDSGKYDARLTSDSSLAQSLGVTGTPGFFVNTSPYPGAYSYNDMKTTVETALK